MKKSDRIKVWNKYRQRCAYCGKHLLYHEMQVDHLIPRGDDFKPGRYASEARIRYCLDLHKKIKGLDNLMPSCRRCNHYKRSYTLENFRKLLKTLDQRINKHYINKVGLDYGVINRVTSWGGVFYFETLKK